MKDKLWLEENTFSLHSLRTLKYEVTCLGRGNKTTKIDKLQLLYFDILKWVTLWFSCLFNVTFYSFSTFQDKYWWTAQQSISETYYWCPCVLQLPRFLLCVSILSLTFFISWNQTYILTLQPLKILKRYSRSTHLSSSSSGAFVIWRAPIT